MEDTLYNNIELFRFVNEPVPSNTYILVNNEKSECVVVDPGSKNPTDIISFICGRKLALKYVILSHEHFDHCWGVNCLQEKFSPVVVTTKSCAEWLSVPMNYFNKLYYNSEESYSVKIDICVENIGWELKWNNVLITFQPAKGHTDKGMCVFIGNSVFTGDTLLLNTCPFIKKRYGGDIYDLYHTIKNIFDDFSGNTVVYPGHGIPFLLKQAKPFYYNYFKQRINKEL